MLEIAASDGRAVRREFELATDEAAKTMRALITAAGNEMPALAEASVFMAYAFWTRGFPRFAGTQFDSHLRQHPTDRFAYHRRPADTTRPHRTPECVAPPRRDEERRMPPRVLDAIEITTAPGKPATHSVLWLHGLGDTGHGHGDVVRSLALPRDAAVRFVLPHAPSIPVTVNMGMVMPAWYDVETLEGERHDVDGVRRSARHLAALVAREIERGVPSERIFLAGFSQGGVVALHLALRHESKLAGAIGLSTYMIGAETLEKEASPANASLPVFMGHGTRDPMVPLRGARAARDVLLARGHDVTWREYPMQHEICLEEIEDVSAWLTARLRG